MRSLTVGQFSSSFSAAKVFAAFLGHASAMNSMSFAGRGFKNSCKTKI